MAIEDSNAERRNLVVTSLSFIVYFLAGGSIDDGKISLPVVNISFDNPAILAVLAWLMLFWFAWRYWQESEKHNFHYFKKDIESEYLTKSMIKYMEKQTNLKHHKEGGFTTNGMHIVDRGWVVEYCAIYNVDLTPEGKLESSSASKEKLFQVVTSIPIKITLIFKAIVNKTTFTGKFVPYILFGISLLLGFIALTSKLVSHLSLTSV